MKQYRRQQDSDLKLQGSGGSLTRDYTSSKQVVSSVAAIRFFFFFFSCFVRDCCLDSRTIVLLISVFSAWTADPQPGSPALPLSEHWGSREAVPLGSPRNCCRCVCTAGCGQQQLLLNSMQGKLGESI